MKSKQKDSSYTDVARSHPQQDSVSGLKDGRGRITTLDNIFIIVECWAIFSTASLLTAWKPSYVVGRVCHWWFSKSIALFLGSNTKIQLSSRKFIDMVVA